MAIDGLGGGRSRDSNYEVRRRLLEEERARELERIEKHHKEEVATVEKAREQALRNIYENQTSDIEGKRADADSRIAQAKLAAENRIKDYEQDAMRMADEAKRQFAQKADLLARNAQEMDKQREFMIKQHTDSMKKLKEEREESQYKQDFKLRQEAGQVYNAHKKSLNDLQERANEELSQLNAETLSAKTKARNERIWEVDALMREKENAKATVSREIEEQKRMGAEQLERDRIHKSISKSVQQEKFDGELADLKRRNQMEVNRAHRDGHKLVEDVKDAYWHQTNELDKDSRKRTQSQQMSASAAMSTIENNYKLEEKLAREGFEHKKRVLQERRDNYLDKATVEADTLQKKVDENFKTSAKTLEKTRGEALTKHTDQVHKELAYRRTQGERQLAALNQAHAKSVSSHANRASDPFYRVHTIDAQVKNSETECVVTIAVPDHEKETVRLTLQADGLCVTGSRRYEDKMKTDDGRKVTTNAFQSYTETFPVTGKLEMKKMTRSYDDGVLTFRIPKG